MDHLIFAPTFQKAKYDKVAHLFLAPGRACPKEEFESLNNDDAQPNGTLVLIGDDDFPLMLNSQAEVRFAKLLASTGMVRAIRGQNFILPYRKGWAKKLSPYYPDFLVHLKDGRIAIIELKSSLGMCQDETICKYSYLRAFCTQRGYLYAIIDIDYLTFEEYLWPFPEDGISRYFRTCIDTLGGFNSIQLEGLLRRFPRNKHQEIRRKIATLTLLDPCLSNRYCHDDPRFINVVKETLPLDYKRF